MRNPRSQGAKAAVRKMPTAVRREVPFHFHACLGESPTSRRFLQPVSLTLYSARVCTSVTRTLESKALASCPQAPWNTEYEKTQPSQNPGEHRQTEEVRQVVNLPEGTSREDRFVHPASCRRSTWV